MPRLCYTAPITNIIIPSAFKLLPTSMINPTYASVITVLLQNGFIQDTTGQNFSAFLAAITNQSSNPSIISAYGLYEQYILSIIQYVTDGITIDTILAKLKPMQDTIRSYAQAESTILTIEEVLISIVNNLTNRVNLDLVLGRITYLKGLLKTSTNLPVVYGEIYQLITDIIVSITNRTPIDAIIANLLSIQTAFATEVKLAEVVSRIQSCLIGILQNIIDRVNLTFVLNRFTYVRQLLAEAKML